MAEAVALMALAAAITQLVDYGRAIAARISDYRTTVSGSPRAFKGLETNLPLIVDALNRIGNQAKSGAVSEETSRALFPVIVDYHALIKSLNEILVKVLPLSTDALAPHMQALLRCSVTTSTEELQEASLLHAIAMYDKNQGRYDAARQNLQEALEVRKRQPGDEAPEGFLTLKEQGRLAEKLSRYVEAENLHQQAYIGRAKALGEESRLTLNSLHRLGGLLRYQGKWKAARDTQRLAYELKKKVLGPDDSDTLRTLSAWAINESSIGNLDNAEHLLR